MDEKSTDVAIRADFDALLVERAVDLLGPRVVSEVIGARTGRGLFGLGRDKAARALDEADDAVLLHKTETLISLVSNAFGANLAERYLEDIYTALEKEHSPALANSVILPLIPADYLEKYRLHVLSKEELEERVLEKTREVQKLSELDKRKTEFLSVVAHQLRTPLTGIKWALALLLSNQTQPLSEEQKNLIVSCEDGNERMITIVNTMLRADRISSETFLIAPVETDVVALIDGVVKGLTLSAQQRGVTVTFSHGDPIPPLTIDPEMIRFAFENLVDNALRYSAPHGTVEVHAEVKDGQVVCSVTDHGIGIEQDQQPYIFSRFFRTKKAIATEPNGSGLGLFIVKSILEKHGGSVRFVSEENKGTTFFLSLPIITGQHGPTNNPE